MTSSAAGATAFFVLALLTICTLVVLLLRYYIPLRSTPAYVTISVFLSIALPASIVLLVPIDLASSAGTDTEGARGIWLSDKVVYKSWRVTYWLTFALTWIILPYLGEYCDSGYRDPKDRLLYAIRDNGRYQLMMIVSAVLGAIYLLWQTGFHFSNVKVLAMALAYTWGLVLAIYLMGHGLVALPRALYRYANISNRLRILQSHAPKVHERFSDAQDKLREYEDQVAQLKQRKNGTAVEFQYWIEELAESSNVPEGSVGLAASTTSARPPPVITARYLAELTRKLKRARHAKMRFFAEWDHLVASALRTQAILDSKASKRLEFRPGQSDALSRYAPLTPYTRYLIHVHIIPALYYFASFTGILASISIIWSECVRALDPKLSLIGLTVIHHPPSSRGQIGFGGQVIAAAWLCYMCVCAFFSLTEVKVWGNRALVRRGTYLESATWYSLQIAKLTVPLAYNFITFTPPVVYKETGFHRFLGSSIDLTPLGRNFSDFFPAFILVPVFASAFGLYTKVKNLFGFGDLLEDDEDGEGSPYGTGSWREGRALIDREMHNSNGTALGLTSRNGLALSSGERYRDGPSASSGRTRHRSTAEDEELEGNFFTDFAARVKNTFDTRDITISRPRWMASEGAGSSRGGSDNQDRNTSWLSFFGGRPDEGRLRL
ncbi:hypothetical protein M011DRAFT_479094 [Sporormia fimetaria CBS 119925]|uniref:Uncharacterized protein n=1 Tax=Sporormia fimetaria CBS 119925 TaxID=1340428 RepID=A0A6A6V5S3_9PLEO|nr:hypothetical protein M011DRAFT_479094 [Sporormia fimetaria CBS 119925]